MEEIILIRRNHAAKTRLLFFLTLLISVLMLFYLYNLIRLYLIMCAFVWTLFCLRLIFVKLFSSKEPVIIMDDEGLLDKRLGFGKILWVDIDRVYSWRYRNYRTICIETKRDEFYLNRCGRLKVEQQLFGTAGLSALNLQTNFLDIEHDQIFKLIANKQKAALSA